MKEREIFQEKESIFYRTYISFFGILSVVLLVLTLFFLSGITGSVIGPTQGNYYGLIFIIALFLVVTILEISLILKRNKKNLEIKELIREYREKMAKIRCFF